MATTESSSTRRAVSRFRWLRVGVRAWIRRFLFLSFAGATLWLVNECIGGRCRLQWELIAAQRECLRAPDPPGRMLFDADPSHAAELIQHGYGAVTWDLWSEFGTQTPTNAAVAVWEQRVERLRQAKQAIERWRDLRTMPADPADSRGGGGGGSGRGLFSSKTFSGPGTAIACLERRAAGGERRMVILEILSDRGNGTITGFGATIIKPCTWFSDIEGMGGFIAEVPDASGQLKQVELPHEPDQPWVRVYSTAIPADEACFALAFEVGDRKGSIEGRLQADDTIVWTLHPPPTTQAQSTSTTQRYELPEPIPPKMPVP
jgi:hypothetical protein